MCRRNPLITTRRLRKVVNRHFGQVPRYRGLDLIDRDETIRRGKFWRSFIHELFRLRLDIGACIEYYYVSDESHRTGTYTILSRGRDQSGMVSMLCSSNYNWIFYINLFSRVWTRATNVLSTTRWWTSHAKRTVANTSSLLPSCSQTWNTTRAWKSSVSTTANGFLKKLQGTWWSWSIVTFPFNNTRELGLLRCPIIFWDWWADLL